MDTRQRLARMSGLEPSVEAIQVDLVTPVYRKVGDQLIFPDEPAGRPMLLIFWTWCVA